MSGKVRGRVCVLGETKSYGAKGFRKREMVLEQENGSFTNYIPIDFTRDACDLADELRIGDDVEVTYSLSGRKWQRDGESEVKYFLSAEATSFRVVGEFSGPKPDTVSGEDSGVDSDAPF
jgi:hypothetical protein